MKYTVSLKYNHVFQRLYRRGTRSATSCLALYSRPNGTGVSRLGITTGKKLGKAVVRNRARRRVREIYRRAEEQLLPGRDIVVVVRIAGVDAPFSRLEKDFMKLCRKNGLVKEK